MSKRKRSRLSRKLTPVQKKQRAFKALTLGKRKALERLSEEKRFLSFQLGKEERLIKRGRLAEASQVFLATERAFVAGGKFPPKRTAKQIADRRRSAFIRRKESVRVGKLKKVSRTDKQIADRRRSAIIRRKESKQRKQQKETMSKRRRTAPGLTGGTGDVNPQTLGGSVTLSSANTYTQIEIQLPVNRALPGRRNMAQVVEALWVEFDIGPSESFNLLTEAMRAQVTTASQTVVVPISDSSMIAKMSVNMSILTTGGGILNDIYHFDLHDGNGHGLLIATQSMFFGVNSVGLTGAAGASFRMGYRIKNVGVTEFLGITLQQTG